MTEGSARPPPLLRAPGRLAVSVVLLLLLAATIDPVEVRDRLVDLDARWVALGLGVSVLQVLLLAWRWRHTAGRLGVQLPYGDALREYYFGILLNQLLPGGVAGDVSRAWRHARSEAQTAPAVQAVILERLAGQLVMTTTAVACVAGLIVFGVFGAVLEALAAALATVAIGAWTLARLVRRAGTRVAPESRVGRLRAAAGRTLWARSAALPQWGSAVVVVASYVGVYLVAARAVGVETPALRLAPLVAPVLMAMLLPVTIAGWGVRESAAALLWSAVGLSAEDGVAISVAYGLLVLLAALPGVATVIGPRSVPGPNRRGGRPRRGSDEPPVGGRRPGSRSGEA